MIKISVDCDERFTIWYNADDAIYHILYECDREKYSHWTFRGCLEWLHRHGYMETDAYVEEIGVQNINV